MIYLKFTKEPVDGVLAHSVDLASVQRDSSVWLAVLSRHLLQTHQALPSLQQYAEDHETGLHVSLRHTHTHTQTSETYCIHLMTLIHINSETDTASTLKKHRRTKLEQADFKNVVCRRVL